MVDKVAAIRRDRVGAVIGSLPPEAALALNDALVLVLGLAD